MIMGVVFAGTYNKNHPVAGKGGGGLDTIGSTDGLPGCITLQFDKCLLGPLLLSLLFLADGTSYGTDPAFCFRNSLGFE